MKLSLLLSLLGLVSSPTFAATPKPLDTLKQARDLEKFQPDKACEIEQKLASDKTFLLQDIAFLHQGMICLKPLEDVPYDLKSKPWLTKADLERKKRLSFLKQDLVAETEIRTSLAKLEKSQKDSLQMLQETEDFISKNAATDELKKAALLLVVKARQEVAPRFLPNPGPTDQLKVAQDFLAAREFNEARKWAQKILGRGNAGFDEQLAARRVRRSSYKLESKTDQFLKFLKLDWQWAKGQKNLNKSFEMGLIYARALWTEGQNPKARQVLSEMQSHFGKFRVNDIHFIHGKMSEERRDWVAALEYYEKAKIDLTTATDKKIQFAKAWVSWKSKNDDKAIAALDSLIALDQDEPFESSRALYWKSRVQSRGGKGEEARATLKQLQKQDPLGFYGTLSYRDLKEKFPPLKIPQVPSTFQPSSLYNADYFQALLDMGELEILQSAATIALQAVQPQDAAENWLPLFMAAARANSYLPLFSQISSLTPENRKLLLEKDPQLVFPLDFLDLIKVSAKKFEIAPELSLSIIRQESAFNPFARSFADALGLMQLLPNVANSFQTIVGIPVTRFEDLYKPEVNIPYGTALLKDLLKRHDQKVFLAAAAYNASEKALKMWLKMRWTGDPIEFIEEIPYEETRAYVKLIIRNYAFYSRMLQNGTPSGFPQACLGD